jgi:hypothetical protein
MLGPDHPDIALKLDNLAVTYLSLGQADKALPLQQRVSLLNRGLRVRCGFRCGLMVTFGGGG